MRKFTDVKNSVVFFFSEFVCPNIGFFQFLSSAYLYEIITWQKENGCFGSMPRTANSKGDDFDYDYEDDSTEGNTSPPPSRQTMENSYNASHSGAVVQRGQKLVQQFPNKDSINQDLKDNVMKPLQRGLLSVSDSKTYRSRKLLVEKAMSGRLSLSLSLSLSECC